MSNISESKINMKLFKQLSAIGVAVGMAATFATATSAVNRTAYSIGVKYYATSSATTYDDFTTSAANAQSAYSNISGITSSRTQFPTTTILKNHINDNVIFLNSHANYDRISFRYKNSSGTYVQNGYIMGTDSNASNGTKFIGLSNLNMSNVELITFAGCKTASTSGQNDHNNITATAVAQVAKCAVGFTKEIHSRNTTGKAWLKSYNNYLASGCNVGEAVHKATQDNSTSNLGQYVSILGYGADKITTSLAKAADFSCGVSDVVTSEDILGSESALLNFMQSYDSNFNSNEYRYYVNIFNKESNTGMVVFNHYINDQIITNKSYVICIENGFVTDVLESNVNKNVDEEVLCAQAAAFSSQPALASYQIEGNIYKTDEFYEYDYITNELRYIKVEYSLSEAGEIIENVTETVILG